ncbi:cell division protein ZapD [Alteromonas sp. CYL-A6]|uniref:cell division protein ZapD n=1 Tax=Alteromonas nitratireducens TaxID=3390813 RepID=UPI0034AF9295
MTDAVLEFPLKEKVRNYLRVEQLLGLVKAAAKAQEPQFQFIFFEQLFVLLDLVERLDLRTDMLKDLDVHEKSLVYWSQHPKIDSEALEQTLKRLISLRERLKNASRFGSALKEDKLLSSIRQRFSIPGGACSFDLPNLHYWQHQPAPVKQADCARWLDTLSLLDDAVALSLSFLRERGTFTEQVAQNGFYQGAAEDKNELIRVRYACDQGYYPTLSGNKYRYALRFMYYAPEPSQPSAVEQAVNFKLAIC